MRRAVFVLLSALCITARPSFHAQAANKCVDCQKRCFARTVVRCEKKHGDKYCYGELSGVYASCKLKCKGSAVCV
jgi:hypothetical protein